MMLLATVSLRNVSRHLVGVVGPYKQPYSKTLSLYRATYAVEQQRLCFPPNVANFLCIHTWYTADNNRLFTISIMKK